MASPAAPDLATAARPGARLGRYVLRERIGAGGMGEVFRGWQEAPGGIRRSVVLKLIRPDRLHDPDATRRFVEEARVWMRLQHPHVVAMYDVGHENGLWFLVLAEVEGAALSAVLRRGGPLGVEGAAVLVADVADALDHVHTRAGDAGEALHLVHRDVCPANILVDTRGAAHLTDFGIARAAGAVHGVEGHLGHLAPEQARGGHVGAAADLWALGVVWWEALTGQSPFAPAGREGLLAALRAEPVRLPPAPDGLPPAQAALLLRCLHARPAERPAAAELRDALRALVPPTPSLRRDIGGRAAAPAAPALGPEDAPTVWAATAVDATAATALGLDTAATTLDPAAAASPLGAAPHAPAPPRGARRWSAALAGVLVLSVAGALGAVWPGPPPPPAARTAAPAAPSAPAGAAAPPPVPAPASAPAPAAPVAALPSGGQAPAPAAAAAAAAAAPTPARPAPAPPPPVRAPAVAASPAPAPPPPAPSAAPAPPAAPAAAPLPAGDATLRVEIHGDFARICVDGDCARRPARSASFTLSPGPHRVEAELRTSGRRVSEQLTLAPGETRTLRVEGDPGALVAPGGSAP